LKSHTSAAQCLDIAVVLDSPDEQWPSMDLVGEMLLQEWRALSGGVVVEAIELRFRDGARRMPGIGLLREAFNADRAFTRYVEYSLRAIAARRSGRLFHIVDHSYSHLVHLLPAHRTGVYCHDLDAFRAILQPEVDFAERRSERHRALAWTLRAAIRSAAIVFHSTREVAQALEHHGIATRSQLVYAPYGVAPEFRPSGELEEGPEELGIPLDGGRYLLHVGSGVERKRLDVLFEVFARLQARRPGLRLIQVGASLSAAQLAHVASLGIRDHFFQPPKLPRPALAALYRGASVVLLTSDSEGFGLPVVEASACGATVVASNIPVLREVGGEGVVYAPVGDIEAWSGIVGRILDDPTTAPPRHLRLAKASDFSWQRHARTIMEAYTELSP
jgi:glycosyltransferase involved in cell wall biosynthesis